MDSKSFFRRFFQTSYEQQDLELKVDFQFFFIQNLMAFAEESPKRIFSFIWNGQWFFGVNG